MYILGLMLFLDSVATWFCIGTSGQFGFNTTTGEYIITSEPDRSKCIHQWIEDVEKQVFNTYLVLILRTNFILCEGGRVWD